ncbi:hypothetical protein V7S43_010275 [Phytophthora oleae]|uniref:Uncharacterized protein n=1 Tax=Phytophthora oleae TaxID=2107226 RepID=A0ABD3FF33_9STRA
MAYHYDVCDIAGDDNVWADRWGSTLHKICAVRLVPYEHSPTLNEWPMMAEIAQCQRDSQRPVDLELESDLQGLLRLAGGQVWIPADAGSL